ncbi:hypothetical protein V6N12_052332 [Hibiscus sabdariffa]|uniref:Uncharacterized protein n=1 Tax=Hibiscus sabdariffa TaxID=183260 RepID=A0ABR2GHX4_9ROSI
MNRIFVRFERHQSSYFVAEGPNIYVAFVTEEQELLMPKFEQILSGFTTKRILTLAEDLIPRPTCCLILLSLTVHVLRDWHVIIQLDLELQTLGSTLYFQKFRGITMDNVRVDEAWKSTDEMMLVGSGSLVRPVIQIQWDEQVIGDGKEGPPSETLLNFIPEDMNPVLHRSEYQFLIEAKLDS